MTETADQKLRQSTGPVSRSVADSLAEVLEHVEEATRDVGTYVDRDRVIRALTEYRIEVS